MAISSSSGWGRGGPLGPLPGGPLVAPEPEVAPFLRHRLRRLLRLGGVSAVGECSGEHSLASAGAGGSTAVVSSIQYSTVVSKSSDILQNIQSV